MVFSRTQLQDIPQLVPVIGLDDNGAVIHKVDGMKLQPVQPPLYNVHDNGDLQDADKEDERVKDLALSFPIPMDSGRALIIIQFSFFGWLY